MLKLCAEARIDKFIPVDHPVVSWLLEHTCLILSVRVRGSDGLTAWARVRGRAFNQRMLSFLENVFYKLPTKSPQAAPVGNMGTRWAVRTFLGYSRNSNCYLVSTAGGVVQARCLQRRPTEERWSRRGGPGAGNALIITRMTRGRSPLPRTRYGARRRSRSRTTSIAPPDAHQQSRPRQIRLHRGMPTMPAFRRVQRLQAKRGTHRPVSGQARGGDGKRRAWPCTPRGVRHKRQQTHRGKNP